MPSEEENDEVKKARFYYEAVVKADEISTRSYERTNSKISLFIGVLSTVIPILTGLGYLVLSNKIVVPFFIFYVISLSFFVIALAKCVHLLAPKYFFCVDFGKLMEKYEKNPLGFIIFKIGHTLEYAVKENVNRILSLRSGLQRTVQLIIIGLVALVFSFVLLGMNYYMFDILIEGGFYKNIMSESSLQLFLLVIFLGIFAVITIFIMQYTSVEAENLNCINTTNDSPPSEKKDFHQQGFFLFYGGLFGLLVGIWHACIAWVRNSV